MTAQVDEILILNGKRRSMLSVLPLPDDRPELRMLWPKEANSLDYLLALKLARHRLVEDARKAEAMGQPFDLGEKYRLALPIALAKSEAELEEILDGMDAWTTTACWRRYRAAWRIRDDRLDLVEIDGRYRLTRPGPLFADWVTATLRVPLGEPLARMHMGYCAFYRRELFLRVEAGIVTARRVLRGPEIYSGPTLDQWIDGSLPGGENRFAEKVKM